MYSRRGNILSSLSINLCLESGRRISLSNLYSWAFCPRHGYLHSSKPFRRPIPEWVHCFSSQAKKQFSILQSNLQETWIHLFILGSLENDFLATTIDCKRPCRWTSVVTQNLLMSSEYSVLDSASLFASYMLDLHHIISKHIRECSTNYKLRDDLNKRLKTFDVSDYMMSLRSYMLAMLAHSIDLKKIWMSMLMS